MVRLSILVLALPLALAAQPDTLWTRTLGGPADEPVGLTSIGNFGSPGFSSDRSDDGGLFVVTSTASSSGDVPGNLGQEDIWVIRMNENGDTLWTRLLGGSGGERPGTVLALPDGGCVFTGRTFSGDGLFPDNHSGMHDGFVVRMDEQGEVIWSACYGGTADDFLYSMVLSSDGNLVACGETGSNDGNLVNTGIGLNWTVKVALEDGALIWSKAYEGPDHAGGNEDLLENFTEITALPDGSGYLCAGFTTPEFNDFNQDDILLAKLNAFGNLVWIRQVGSATGGDYPCAIRAEENGEFYVAGRLNGSGGDASVFHGGGGDFWLLHFNSDGTLDWERNYGGSDYDFAFDLEMLPDGRMWVGGFTRSTDLDAGAPAFGLMDCWLLSLDASGELLYSLRYGGSANDVIMDVVPVPDADRVIAAGRTASSDAYVHGLQGGLDVFLAAWGGLPSSVERLQESSAFHVFPNPTSKFVTLHWPVGADVDRVDVRDSNGRTVLSESALERGRMQLNLQDEAAGVYTIHPVGTGILPVVRLIRE